MTQQSFDSVMHALSDSTRRAIVDRLTKGPTRVTDLAAPFPMSLNAISKHIKVLESAGIVNRTQHGREHTLALDPGPIREVARWASRYEKFWNERLDNLEAHFKSKNVKHLKKGRS